MTGPNLISDRLRQSVIAASFAHPDGRPNKRAFARAMCDADGGDWKTDQNSWEQNVYRWLDEENPGGMSDKMAELASRVLGKDPEYFKEQTATRALLQEQKETAVLLSRLSEVVEQLERRLRVVEDAVLGTRHDP